MKKIYLSELDDKQRQVVEQMQAMTPDQQSWFARFVERLAGDDDGSFTMALKKNMPVVQALIRAGNLHAVDRWMRRHTIKAIK